MKGPSLSVSLIGKNRKYMSQPKSLFQIQQQLAAPFGKLKHPTSQIGVGEDAALLTSLTEGGTLLSSQMLLEGIHFDLVYFPLQYLGFKAVTAAVADLVAMGGRPEQLYLNIGTSQRFTEVDIQILLRGAREACELYQLDLIGLTPSTSLTGLTIGATALGSLRLDSVLRRSGAEPNQLLCLTGNVGAAYMGLQLLLREKAAFGKSGEGFIPHFEGREYILGRQMKPIARLDILYALQEAGIRPTAMIGVRQGLANDLLTLAEASGVGARLYEQKIPVDHETVGMAQDFGLEPTTVALHGGEDYELLFTIPLGMKDLVDALPDIHQIGYMTTADEGVRLISSGGSETTLHPFRMNTIAE